MALIKCSDCGKDVSDSAPTCLNCGKPVITKRRIRGFTLFLIIFIGFVVLLSNIPSQKSSVMSSVKSEQKVDFSAIEKGVNDLRVSGLIQKLNPNLNEVFISKAIWDTTTYDQKKTFGYVLGHYCGHIKGTNLYWVDIRDHKSGKKLAKWSKSWGMKIED